MLFLVRDRTGVRPLFHARAGSLVVSGTSARDVLGADAVSREPSALALAAWLAGELSDPAETLFASLRRVPPGHVLAVGRAGEKLHEAWAPAPAGSLAADEAERFGDVLERAVRRALAGRPGAVFLSGGLDSSAVAIAAARAGDVPPLALCVDVEGASEVAMQRAVGDGLGLPQLFAAARSGEGLLGRALERTAGSLWPIGSAWSPVFDGLVLDARESGVRVILDGQGGDELLDATLLRGRELLRRRKLGGMIDLIRADRAYTGSSRVTTLRGALGALRNAPGRPRELPAWLAPDPVVRRALVEQAATPMPRSHAAIRRADLLDPYMAHAREDAFDAAEHREMTHCHPLWDAEVVALLCGLPPEAFVRGGEPKSPARAYVRSRIPSLEEPWPRPQVANDLLSAIVEEQGPSLWQQLGGPRLLGSLGVLNPDHPFARFAPGHVWAIMSLEQWLRRQGSEVVPHDSSVT
jgi:asparagine synthase (glutamine-hydrolysing)